MTGRDVDLLGRKLSGKILKGSGLMRQFKMQHIRLGVREPCAVQGFLGLLHVVHDNL